MELSRTSEVGALSLILDVRKRLDTWTGLLGLDTSITSIALLRYDAV